MKHPRILLGFLLPAVFVLLAFETPVRPADLPTATPEDLKTVYFQLRQLHASEQWAIAENVVWKRDAATFTFQTGKLVFASPVNGRILAASFEGKGAFQLDPPGSIHQKQISRYTRGPNLTDTFRKAVLFFTDDSFAELQQKLKIQSGGTVASDAIASTQREFTETFNDWWSNEAKGNFEMRNMAARMLADLADPSSKGFCLADFKGDRSGDLMFHISWNRDSLLMPGLNNDEEVVLLHYNPGNYYEWWSGFHLAEEYAKNPHPEHRTLLARCPRQTIVAGVADDNRLSATTELDYEIGYGSPRLLPLNLRGVLRISSIQDGGGKPLAFIQEPRELDNDPWVILPAPAQKGIAARMKIAYAEDSNRDNRIIHQRGSGLYFVTARTSWFPSFGAFDDRTIFVLRFRSPKKFTLIGTGHRLKAEKQKDAYVSEWESEIPFAVAGFNYGEFADKTRSDGTLTVTAYGGKQIPDELREVEIAGGGVGGLNTTSMLDYAAGVSFQAMKLFEFYFGPLPFKSIAVTEQPVRGFGQSWPTLVFLPYDSLLDGTNRHFLGLQESEEARQFYNIVAVHEMAHQWWGHLVGWKTYHDQWLSEGIAEFSAALFIKHFEPKKWKGYWDLKRKWLFSTNRRGHRIKDVGPLWLNFQLSGHLEEENRQSLVYGKGAFVLEMLRMLMENPQDRNPDGAFIAMMRDFTASHAGRNASTEDFRRIVEKHWRRPMDWFFNQWVYGTEIPDYKFTYQLKDAPGGKTNLQISLTQSSVSDSFRMAVPLYLHHKGQPHRLGLVEMKGSTTHNDEMTLPIRPEKVTIDEYHSILCESRE